MNSDTEIKKLVEWDLPHFSGNEEHFFFGLKEIEHHLPELRDLYQSKNPHLYDEVADVYIWAKMLLLTKNVSEGTILQRVNRFREKIKQFRKLE